MATENSPPPKELSDALYDGLVRKRQPDNEYCVDVEVTAPSISEQALEIVKVRDAIVHLAIHHRDTTDLEILGVAVSSLGRRLYRLMDGVV